MHMEAYMDTNERDQAGGGKTTDDSLQAGKEGGAPARTETVNAPAGQQAQPAGDPDPKGAAEGEAMTPSKQED